MAARRRAKRGTFQQASPESGASSSTIAQQQATCNAAHRRANPDPNLGSDTTVVEPWWIRIMPPDEAAEEHKLGRETINTIQNMQSYEPFIGCFSGLPFWRLGAWLRPVSRENWHFTPALEGLTRSAWMDSPRQVGRNKFRRGGGVHRPTDEHSVHPHHRDFIITPIAHQIGPIDSVSKIEFYDLKNHFSEPQCKMTVLPLNVGKSRFDPCLLLGSRTPQSPPRVLNTLSSVSVRKSQIQYLLDLAWFKDTASRGPTTIAAPESQFRTCPSDHVSRRNRHFTVGDGRLRQSGPRLETISLRSACTRRLKNFIANGFSSKSWPEQVRRTAAAAATSGGGGGVRRGREAAAF
ncbi:hypothetical protein F511_15126 [Dorcoceras hygrometricum]|uniref:Uncharacterized protein n=1 Tax=Dorcoceras hygrometricum TaxID=472368 RepID=A0A2Z7BM95_9LAMI|nr:hypothetical protein F511_15126 [Dorcoceras hygrometricum]